MIGRKKENKTISLSLSLVKKENEINEADIEIIKERVNSEYSHFRTLFGVIYTDTYSSYPLDTIDLIQGSKE